jgi:predicted ribosome quality control (RQC) complex YloA/Tae2 family protein
MKFREITLKNGVKILLGRDAKSNDDLMRKFKGKPNTILHTQAPGSPFCVIDNKIKPTKTDLTLSGAVCASYSQDWRDNKTGVVVNVFTGKDISKGLFSKQGTWKVRKSKKIKVKKADILKYKQEK